MEAGGVLDFARFEALTRERNGHLPEKLDYGSRIEFHAPDDKRFAITFALTGDKYRARVVDLSEPIETYDSLPLASGRYMRTPGGHDGLIEIRDPRAEDIPLVLDYRDAEHPRRSDTKTGNPAPWIERAVAFFAVAA